MSPTANKTPKTTGSTKTLKTLSGPKSIQRVQARDLLKLQDLFTDWASEYTVLEGHLAEAHKRLKKCQNRFNRFTAVKRHLEAQRPGERAPQAIRLPVGAVSPVGTT